MVLLTARCASSVWSNRVVERINLASIARHVPYYRSRRPRRTFNGPAVRQLSTSDCRRLKVLGIETSCDDTGAAVVDDQGNILGEAINSQTAIHVEMGGIIPPVARDLHMKNVEGVINSALKCAGLSAADVDAVATTVKPGLALSLYVGLHHGRNLAKMFRKPFIPIHHMEAHALMARMTHGVDFPYLVLLISGGHSLLAVVRSADDFLLIGKGLDDAPGDAFDKTARRLKLKNLPHCAGLSGGRAIEVAAENGDPRAYELHTVMSQTPDCNFSFAGIKGWAQQTVIKEERKQGVEASGILPNVSDICASFQFMVLHHLAKRVQRGLLYCELKQLLPADGLRTLVVSGGVASNAFIRAGLERLCARYSCQVVCPPVRLCTDNGVMIAWNGIERLRLGIGIAEDPDSIDIQAKCPLGVDVTDDVRHCHIKLPYIKLL